MSLLDKFKGLESQRALLMRIGRDPFGVCLERILSPTQAIIEGRQTILAGSNNYLGLTMDEAGIKAARDAVADFGTGTTGSRLANGTYGPHRELEAALAEFLGFTGAMVFSTGYTANLGALSGLADADDMIFIDSDCHASIYDGCRLAGAQTIRFRHNSAEDLAKRLKRADFDGGKLVVVEGMYSMFGDIAPLDELAAAAHEAGAMILVDEAHSFGVFGEHGRGVAESQGVLDKMDFYTGTFSKSLASIGGFLASNHEAFEMIRVASRPYMFTASPAPSSIAGARSALEAIRTRPELRDKLWANAHRLHETLSAQGHDLCAQASPVIAVRQSDRASAALFWNALLEAGVYANLAIPPGTPNSASLIRLSVSAAHSFEEIDAIAEALNTARSRLSNMAETPAASAASAAP